MGKANPGRAAGLASLQRAVGSTARGTAGAPPQVGGTMATHDSRAAEGGGGAVQAVAGTSSPGKRDDPQTLPGLPESSPGRAGKGPARVQVVPGFDSPAAAGPPRAMAEISPGGAKGS